MDYDDYYSYPKRGRVSPVGWLMTVGRATCRPLCNCCGGSQGVRAAKRKYNMHQDSVRDKTLRRFNSETRGRKPRRKNHR